MPAAESEGIEVAKAQKALAWVCFSHSPGQQLAGSWEAIEAAALAAVPVHPCGQRAWSSLPHTPVLQPSPDKVQ
eukprot:7355701-Alexandrium_andersonii.AAC.1